MDIAQVPLLTPWSHVEDGRGLEAELARELVRGHTLFGRKMRAVARRIDHDDVLFVEEPLGGGPFRTAPGECAVVHLTWSKETDPRWPSTQTYRTLDAWIAECMKPDHEDYEDDPRPRSFAMEFRCARALDAIYGVLRQDVRALWTMRDGHLTATDGTTQVRIFQKATRFLIQVDRRDPLAADDAWHPRAYDAAIALLRLLGATHIEGCWPEHE